MQTLCWRHWMVVLLTPRRGCSGLHWGPNGGLCRGELCELRRRGALWGLPRLLLVLRVHWGSYSWLVSNALL